MQNIFEKIDNIFDEKSSDEIVELFNEILVELKDIKTLLSENKKTTQNIDKKFYQFVKDFRISMKANVEEGIYPDFIYHERRLGINFKGLLYDKDTRKLLSKDEAFKVYDFAYKQSKVMV